MSTLRFEFNEFLGDVVSGPLRQNPQHRPSGLIESNIARQRTPAGAAAAFGHVAQLQHSDADETVFTSETIVFDAEMQFVAIRFRLVAKDTTNKPTSRHRSSTSVRHEKVG